MPATETPLLTRWETSLDVLRTHPALGPLVRFYFRRREQILYLVVGGWNTVFGYGVWAVLQYLLGSHVHYLVVIVLSWPLAVLNAYLGYRFVVFQSEGPLLRELPRFSLVYLATLIANLALLPLALNALPFSIYVIQALFTAVVVVVSYLGHKYYSFRRGRGRDDTDEAAYDPTPGSGEI
jgi:putative flippase GtrA